MAQRLARNKTTHRVAHDNDAALRAHIGAALVQAQDGDDCVVQKLRLLRDHGAAQCRGLLAEVEREVLKPWDTDVAAVGMLQFAKLIRERAQGAHLADVAEVARHEEHGHAADV